MEKGISLTIHSVIIIVLAILVLVIIAFFFITGTDPLRAMKYQSAFDRGCKIHLETGRSADSILLDDLDGDGKPNTLLDACRLYFADSNLTPENCSQKCKQKFPFEFEAPSGEAPETPGSGTQPYSKGLGEACSSDYECASGHCTYIDQQCRSEIKNCDNPPCTRACTNNKAGGEACGPYTETKCDFNCASGLCTCPAGSGSCTVRDTCAPEPIY